MATTNLGRVAIVPKGTWNASTTYKKLDLVTFEGSSYIALQNNSNKPVSNTTYWQKIAQKGDQGIQGIQGIQGETGNGITSIELTNTSGAVKTYTITYTNGNTTTFQVTDGEVTNEVLAEELEAYALIDGYYEEMTVGAAENLTGKGTGVPAMFTRRTTGGDADVADGIATLNKIKGNTFVLNQYIENGDFSTASPAGWNSPGNATLVVDTTKHEGVFTYTGTTPRDYLMCRQSRTPLENLQHYSTHKLFITYTYETEKDIAGLFNYFEALSYGTSHENFLFRSKSTLLKGKHVVSDIVTATAYDGQPYASTRIRFGLRDDVPEDLTQYLVVGDVIKVSNVMLIDLTAMFGPGNEPNTVEDFKAIFNSDYLNVTQYSLLNFTGESLKTVGFNQWDEVWETGTIMSSTGENSGDASAIRSKNYIPVFPNTKYCIINSQGAKLRFYDINKNYLGYTPKALSGSDNVKIFITPDDCYYFRFATQPSYGPTYNNDICLNISWSGYRDGEYETYWEREKDIDFSEYFPDGMKNVWAYKNAWTWENGCIIYADEIQKNKIIKRVGSYTYTGNETFNNQQGTYDNDDSFLAHVNISSIGTVEHDNRGFLFNKFFNAGNTQTSGGRNTKPFLANVHPNAQYSSNTYFRLPYSIASGLSKTSTSEEKALAAKNWFTAQYNNSDPVILYYELAEPVEIDLSETPLNLNYLVSDFGTEEILPTNTNTPTTSPINADIVYGMNAADTLRRLPENYISKDSMEAFLSTLNTVTNGTWSMIYNSETSKYVFSYVANAEEQQGGE